MARLAALVAGLLALAPGAHAAPPAPPDQVAFSGVLVDAGGAPLAGPVDLEARLYDAASGGTLIFKQSFSDVGLSDGHYTLNLGPSGEASDAPANPLTTSLRTALAGELVAGPGRYVEITVDMDPPLARVQLVLVPYALRADHALTADVATQALDAQAVNGLDGVALEALYQVYNADGGPPSTDPREGTADPDGDGLVNFVDPDNDDDGLTDTSEINLGTDLNLVTPRLTDLEPTSGRSDEVTQVTVTGTGFLSGLTAHFGPLPATVSNLTPTSFVAAVGPSELPAPVTVSVTVTNLNGEFYTWSNAFSFTAPPFTGEPPLPLPFSVTNAVLAGIEARGEELLIYATQSGGSYNRFAVDTIADGSVAFDKVNLLSGTKPGVVGWNASRVLHALRGWQLTDQLQVIRDASGDEFFQNSEATPLEGPGADPVPRSPGLAFDASGRPGGGYLRLEGAQPTAVAFHDRNGNGNFTGVNEVVAIETVGGAADALGDAGFDAAGRLAYAYYDPGNARVRVAYDRSGDGDFDDSSGGVPELGSIAMATPACLDLSFDGDGRLGLLYALAGTATLLHDLNADGDFADAGESQGLQGSVSGCDLATSPVTGRLLIATNPGGELHLSVDVDGDNDYTDLGEITLLPTPAAVSAPIGVTASASGAVYVLTPLGIVVGPLR